MTQADSTNDTRPVPLVVRPEWRRLADWLTHEQVGQLFLAILDFGYGAEPDFSQDQQLSLCWQMVVQPFLVQNKVRYAARCEQAAAAGKRSGEVRRGLRDAKRTDVQSRSTKRTDVQSRSTKRTDVQSRSTKRTNYKSKFISNPVSLESEAANDGNAIDCLPGLGLNQPSDDIGDTGLRPKRPRRRRQPPKASPPWASWSADDLRKSIDDAVAAKPERGAIADAFWLHYKQPTGDGRIRVATFAAWDTSDQMDAWLLRPRNQSNGQQPVGQCEIKPAASGPSIEEMQELKPWERGYKE